MADKITQLQKELGTIIKGKKEVTDKIIMAVLARGHVLLEDVPVLERQPQLWHFAVLGKWILTGSSLRRM